MYIITPETFKARRNLAFFPLILIAVFYLMLSFSPTFSHIPHLQSEKLFLYTLPVVISFVFYIALPQITITVDKDELQYKNILTTKSINWNDLIKSEISFRYAGRSRNATWVFTASNNKRIEISTILFSKKDKQKIAEIILNHCPQCDASDMVKRFAANDFPWYYV